MRPLRRRLHPLHVLLSGDGLLPGIGRHGRIGSPGSGGRIACGKLLWLRLTTFQQPTMEKRTTIFYGAGDQQRQPEDISPMISKVLKDRGRVLKDERGTC